MVLAEPMIAKPFRAIVVGAGLVGLSLSHALQLANIDHVVLEKHNKVISLKGAGLVIWPGIARVIDQFGILRKIQDTAVPITNQYQRYPDGSPNGSENRIVGIGRMYVSYRRRI